MKKRIKLFSIMLFAGVLFVSSMTAMAQELNSFNTYSMGEWVSDTCRVEGIDSTIKGTYITRKTRGLAVITTRDALRQIYNVPKYCGKEFWFNFYDVDETKAPQSIAVINKTAADLGYQVGPTVNIELGVTEYDKNFTLLPSNGGPVRMIIGIPEGFFDRSKTYAMICVREGGAVSVYPDLDTNPWSVTFDTAGGAGTYAIVRY